MPDTEPIPAAPAEENPSPAAPAAEEAAAPEEVPQADPRTPAESPAERIARFRAATAEFPDLLAVHARAENERRLAALRESAARAEEEQARSAVREQISRWEQEAEAARTDYPALDLKALAGDAKFRGLLSAGLNVREAYEALHLKELTEAAARRGAAEAEQRTAANIRARAARPGEGALAPEAEGTAFRRDPTKLTRRERGELARYMARHPGEKIYFN